MAAIHYSAILAPFQPNNIPIGNVIPGLDLPFAPRVIKVDEDKNEVTVSISQFSKVLFSTNINNNLFILGLQCPIIIKEGDKI